MYLSAIGAFLSVACCTKRHRRFVQPGEEGAEDTGSPKCFLQVPKWGGFPGKMEANFDRGAQQKTRGNSHNKQQRKILPKKTLTRKKNVQMESGSALKQAPRDMVGSSSLGDEAWLGKALSILI